MSKVFISLNSTEAKSLNLTKEGSYVIRSEYVMHIPPVIITDTLGWYLRYSEETINCIEYEVVVTEEFYINHGNGD